MSPTPMPLLTVDRLRAGYGPIDVLHDVGVPPGVINYLPGVGAEAGAALVEHPLVAMIAFTGSRNVGLAINKLAADTDPPRIDM